jgi:DNA polymerase-4
MSLKIIFVDLNSYFASVEQAERPELMGKPVAVVPMMAETTCCLAASYPAKATGIRTGTLVKDARKLCPNIVFVEADHKKYVHYHHKIIAAVEKCFPVWKVFSIDEMAIQLFGREQSLEFAREKALEIKGRIQEINTALTCSIGIAPNRYLAKIASDMQKPNGLVIIQPHELPERLLNLHLRDFPGIGPRMEERLVEKKCSNVRLLLQKTPSEMRELWGGKHGEDFWKLIRGHELEEKDSPCASIGHSRVLSPNSRTSQSAWSHLVALLSKAAMRLREAEYFTRSLQLSLKFLGSSSENSHWDQRVRFPETQDTTFLLKKLSELWASAPQNRILRIGVALSAFVPAHKHQLSLFEDNRKALLMSAFDKLNKKYRKNLVVIAESSELERAREAPIAFGHIPAEFE